MRVFYAVNIDDRAKALIKKTASRLNGYLLAGRAIDLYNYHITIQYIGETSNDRLAYYTSVLDKAAAGMKSSIVSFDKVSSFRRGKSHLIFLEGKYEPGLESVRKNVIDELGLEFRTFLPHITLFRDAVPKTGYTMEKIADELKFGGLECPVENISLMESRTINGRLVYVALYNIRM